MIALAVNTLSERIKGLVIFVSLLPMIVTPLIGSLILFWMIDSRGILGNAIQWLAADPDLSLASTGLTWIMLIVYGLAFCTFCLCCILCRPAQPYRDQWNLPASTERADEQVRYVIIPHLMPADYFICSYPTNG